jgi:hypothetical protein
MMLDQMRNDHSNRPIFAETTSNDEGLANYEDPDELGRRSRHPTHWDESPVEWGGESSIFGVPNVGVSTTLGALQFGQIYTDNLEDLTHAELREAMKSKAGEGLDYSSYLGALGHTLADKAKKQDRGIMDAPGTSYRLEQQKQGAENAPSVWEMQRTWQAEADALSRRSRGIEVQRANDQSRQASAPYMGEDNVQEAYDYEESRIASAHSNMEQAGLSSVYGEKSNLLR